MRVQLPMRGSNAAGITLIELLVVVALVGILTAAAIPSYSAYVIRGQRSAAKTALMQAAQLLERNYTSNGCYEFGTAAECVAGAGTPLTLAANAPADAAPNYTYAITWAFPTPQSFTLKATPCGATTCTGSNMTFVDPDCGFLTLDNTGVENAQVTAAAATCWRR